MPHAVHRRRFLQVAAYGCAGSFAAAELPHLGTASPAVRAAEKQASEKQAADKPTAHRFTLGFSLYGMNSLPLETAIETCAKIGYRDIEPALMTGYTADPSQLTKPRRSELRKQIAGLGLAVPALMENISAVASATTQQANLEKIARAAELAHDLVDVAPIRSTVSGDAGSSRAAPILETVLGGKPSEWPQLRGRILESLQLWAAAGEKHELTIAVKAHVANALHKPEDLAELIAEVGSPRLRAAYDFSHFERQGLELEPSLRALAKQTVFIHVKDGQGTPDAFQFLLPGEGTIDYVAYFRLLDQLQYRGSVMVEVSGQIFKQPGYDPIAAAKKCYHHLQAAYEASVK